MYLLTMTISMLILSALGIFLSRLVILHLFRVDSPIVSTLCGNSDGQSDCDKVMDSAIGKFAGNMHLGDIGLAYFVSQFLFIVLETINNRVGACMQILAYSCLVAFAMTLVLLAAQQFLIKAWCKICLMVTAVIWLQQIALLMQYAFSKGSPQVYFSQAIFESDQLPSWLMLAISMAVGAGWFLLRKAISVAAAAEMTKRNLFGFKRNIQVFKAILKTQRSVDTTLWDDEFLLGGLNTSTRITVVLNPYCPPCGREYQEIMRLLGLFRESLHVAVRFSIPAGENKWTQAVRQLLQAYFSTPAAGKTEVLATWFQMRPTFRNDPVMTPVSPDHRFDGLIEKHRQWCAEVKITHTPTLFINGYEFPPKLYVPSDLRLVLRAFGKQPLKPSSAITVTDTLPAANDGMRKP